MDAGITPGWESVKIYLNGIYQKYCRYANEEKGFIIRAVCDKKGEPIIRSFDRMKLKKEFKEITLVFLQFDDPILLTEKIFGKVEIK